MDPNANLTEQLALARTAVESDPSDANWPSVVRLAELVLALHDWIAHGGFLPAAFLSESGPTPTPAQMLRLGELVRERPDAVRVDVDLMIGTEYRTMTDGAISAEVMVGHVHEKTGPSQVTVAMHTIAPDGKVVPE